VAAACSRIDVLVASARARQPFTHFLSVPLAVPGVQEAFTAWREAVLARSAALPSSLFQQPALLHLTFGTLALLDDREVELAGDLLEECGEQVVRPLLEEAGGLTIALRGLHYMNDDPSEVDVLYCNCGAEEESGRLQQMADQVVDRSSHLDTL
jgi:activating signal cointegrator complex subunit 1